MISELRSKIILLEKHIILLEKSQELKPALATKLLNGQKVNASSNNKQKADIPKKPVQTIAREDTSSMKKMPSKTEIHTGNVNNTVNAELPAETKTQVTEDIPKVIPEHEDVESWVKVARRPRRKTEGITGTKIETAIKTAPKKTFLHVSRLNPTTTTDDLTDMVTKHFPEAVCEQLTSKYPQYYASFKVMIDLNNKEAAMNPNVWPAGSYVTRYFHRSPKQKTPR